jgi:hypothetical protein
MSTETKDRKEGEVYVPASEIMTYLSELAKVLTRMSQGITESIEMLGKKHEGDTNDVNED